MAKKVDAQKRMAELKADAEKNALKYNELILEGKYDEKIENDIKKAVDDYTTLASVEAFKRCVASGNPMHEACINPTFDTIRVADRPAEEGSGIRVREIVSATKIIDLKRLDKFCKAQKVQLGYDDMWIHAVEKFNKHLTARACKRQGIDPKTVDDSYAMSKIARELDLGKNPVSNTNLLKTMNGIIEKMIGPDYKGTSHDVNRLVDTYLKADTRSLLKSKASNHSQLRKSMHAICHRILTDGEYAIDFKVKK